VGCETTRRAVSLRHDGELPEGPEHEALDAHLATCAECSQFERDVARLRSRLRLETVDEAPDIAAAVLAALRDPAEAQAGGPARTAVGRPAASDDRVFRRPAASEVRAFRRPLAAAAVAAVTGMVAGATFVGIGRTPQSPAAADIPAEVVAAQRDVRSVDARFDLVESGQREARTGRLAYRAPEELALRVEGGNTLVVDRDVWWQESRRECSPVTGRVACPESVAHWVTSVIGREPFSPGAPIPLELVTPVDSFALAATADGTGLGSRTIAGHTAVGVTVTAAQVAPFLAGLAEAAELRPVYPTDPVEMWLDAGHLVPLAVEVRAADDPWRPRWAAAEGVVDRAGDTIVSFTVTSLRVNSPIPERVDAGFRGGATAVAPEPGRLPEGFRAHRSGTVSSPGGPRVGLRSWTDGRAWLSVRATDAWSGGRLFGDLGPDVRPIDLGPAGQGYVSADGRLVALHGDGIDVVVSGSLPSDQLQAVAADLGVDGRAVPPGWSEAASGTLAGAARAIPGLLVPRDLDGFGGAAVRREGGTVSQVYAGPGDRGFTLVQDPAAPQLAPSGSGDEVGLTVRGGPGRYSYERGQLEWVEGGTTRVLRSPTLALGELLAIAEGLSPA
jgi:hypothetical protein